MKVVPELLAVRPRIQRCHSCRLKILQVARHDSQAMDACSRRNISITFGMEVRNVQMRRLPGNFETDRQNATVEPGQHT